MLKIFWLFQNGCFYRTVYVQGSKFSKAKVKKIPNTLVHLFVSKFDIFYHSFSLCWSLKSSLRFTYSEKWVKSEKEWSSVFSHWNRNEKNPKCEEHANILALSLSRKSFAPNKPIMIKLFENFSLKMIIWKK